MSPRRPPRLLLATISILAAFTLACMHPGRPSTDRKLGRIESKLDQILEGQALSHEKLDELLALARAQGTGEITLFYPWGRSSLPRSQEDRLVRFLDHLAHEAHGRPILLVAVGTASDWRTDDWNDPLSKRRANAPRTLVGRHLVHVPHKWHKVQGVGDRLTPPDAKGPTWRNVRIIAVYDTEQLPELDAVPAVPR